MRSKLTALFCLWIGLAYSQAPDFSEAINESRKEIQHILNKYPGVSVAVGFGDQMIWTEGFGFADGEALTDVHPDHRFMYYSLSKSIVGCAFYQLISNQTVDPSLPVTQYDESLPSIYEQVTIGQLLSHTAGVRHYQSREWMAISRDNCQTPKEALSVFINDPLVHEPGSNYKYSSFGFVLLSHLLEQITETPFDEYIQKELFDPYGITGIERSTTSDRMNQQAKRYEKWNGNKMKGKEAVVDNSCKFGGGAFVGTPSAIVRFHLDNVLKAEQAGIPLAYESFTPEVTSYAYGMGVNTTQQGLTYYSHTGSGLGGSAALLVYPDLKLAVALAGNIQDDGIRNIVGKVGSSFTRVLAD